MSFVKRAFLYIVRKRTKTLLLLCILLLSSLLILSSLAIMQATECLSKDIEMKMGTKLHMSRGPESEPISDEVIEQVLTVDNVAWANRVSQVNATPLSFINIPGALRQTEEDAMVQVHGYDNVETDGSFADQLMRLQEGAFWDTQQTGLVLVHSDLAVENDLKVGGYIQLRGASGKQTSVTIAGIYALVDSRDAGDMVTSLYRPENQIYATQDVVAQLQIQPGYDEVFYYLSDPSLAIENMERIAALAGSDYEVSVYDTLYNDMKGTLEQTRRIVSLMLGITICVTAAVVTLILSLWMRSRIKEVAVFISLGEHKRNIFFQSLFEIWLVFGFAIILSAISGGLVANAIAGIMLNIPSVEIKLGVPAASIGWLGVGGGALMAVAVLLSLLPVFAMKPRNILTLSE